jgi:membrane-associated protein
MSILDPETIITTGGLALIAFIVFAESGLLFGFFFPGDSLLFLAGTLAAQGQFSIFTAVIVIVISAILGGNVGYLIGSRAGPRVFKKKDGILFRHEYIERSENFYKKHGGKTIILARFIPIVRTFAPVVAGMGKMDRRRFTFYNILGSGIWGIGITTLGYYLGQKIPNIDRYIEPLVIAVIILSFGPAVYHIVSNPKSRKLVAQKLRYLFLRR